MTALAISSVCFKERDLERLCDYALLNSINHIELSGNVDTIADSQLIKIIKRYQTNINFFIHNYFPSPTKSFVLNLAHPKTVSRSIRHCKKVLDLCAVLGIDQYSIHAGMAFNPSPENLGKPQAHFPAISFRDSRDLLVSSCRKIADYGRLHGVDILIENNVIATFNLVKKTNERYHFADLLESELLFHLFDHPNIGILLDVGHLKVTSRVMNFDPLIFINRFKDKIRVVHLNDNNGEEDQNMPVSKDSWFWPHIPWEQLEYVSLEISPQPVSFLKEQIQLIGKKIKE